MTNSKADETASATEEQAESVPATSVEAADNVMVVSASQSGFENPVLHERVLPILQSDHMLPPVTGLRHADLAPGLTSVSRRDGLELIPHFRAWLAGPRVIAFLQSTSGDRLLSGQEWAVIADASATPADRTWRQPWPRGGQLKFAVGLREIQSGTSNEPRYRIAVRIASSRQMPQKTVNQIRSWFYSLFDDLVSFRWTSPPILLGGLPDLTGWLGPNPGHFRIGAPAAIAGGSVGALTLLLRNANGHLALTSGHTILDRFRGHPGDMVYSPPRPVDTQADPLGVVMELRGLPELALENPSDDGPSRPVTMPPEYALVKVDPRFLPHPRDFRRMGNHVVDGSIDRVPPRPGTVVVKSPARTREAVGKVTATDFRLELYDPITNRAVYAEGLTEIQLNDPYKLLAGDSGSLICCQVNNVVRPYGLVLAGMRAAKLTEHNSPIASAIYCVPLASIEAITGMEVA